MKHRKLRVGFVAALSAAAMMLTACSSGGGGQDPTTPDAGGETTTDGNGDASSVPQDFVYVPGLFPVSLDIHDFPGEEGVQVAIQQVLETLVTFDGSEAKPLLAESWEYVTPTELTFKLRSDVTFSDGTLFTANDVKASLDRLIELERALAPLFAAVTEIRVDDDHTFTIVTDSPVGTLVGSLSLLFIGQADKMDDDTYWLAPIGTGPFKIDEYVADDHVTMSRNDDYWGEVALLDTLRMSNIPETAARITAVQTGEVNAVSSIPPDQASNVDGVDGVEFIQTDSFTYYFIWFNHNNKPLDDVRVRQAMWHAVDVDSIIPDLYGDGATVAGAPVAAAVFGATDLPQPKYDPELAKELLADAGYPDGLDISIQWPAAGGPNIKALAQAFISDWAAVGITVDALEKERANWLDDFRSMNWDLNLQTNATPTGDADFTLNRLYTCDADRLGYCNPELDTLLKQAGESLDQDERTDLYAEATQIMWDDAVAIFPADIKANIAYGSNVQGLELPASNRPNFVTVSLTE